MHDRERERDRERAPDRENSATPRPAYRGEVLAHPPCDWDPTAGGRDGMVHPEEPGTGKAHLVTQQDFEGSFYVSFCTLGSKSFWGRN